MGAHTQFLANSRISFDLFSGLRSLRVFLSVTQRNKNFIGISFEIEHAHAIANAHQDIQRVSVREKEER